MNFCNNFYDVGDLWVKIEFLVLMIEKHWSKVNFSGLGEFLSNYHFFNGGWIFSFNDWKTLK